MKLFRKIGPLFLIPLMLFSSIGYGIEIHFCDGEIKNIGLFNVEPCDMGQNLNELENIANLPPCHQKLNTSESKSHENGITKGSCCHNERLSFDNNSELPQVDFPSFKLNHLNIIPAVTVANFNLYNYEVVSVYFQHYRPPLFDADIAVLYQVFRI